VPELEDRVRAAFASVMDPPEEAGARIRDAALRSLEPAPARRAARWTRRALRPVPAIAAAALVAAVAVVLFVATPSDPPAAPVDVTGVELVVCAHPASQTERLADVLRRRGELRGITGMTVTVADGVVHVFVPRTHDTEWPRQSLLTALDTAVYDRSSLVVAADRSLQAVLDALPAPAPGDPVHWYAVRPEKRPGTSGLAGPFATEAEARRAEGFGARAPQPVAVAQDIELVLTDDRTGPVRAGFGFAALRDPLVGPQDIAGVTGGDHELRILVADAERGRVGAALGDGPHELIIAYGGVLPQTVGTARFDRWDAAAGALVFRIPHRAGLPDWAADLARMLAPGGVDADLEVVSSVPVGPAPVRRGEAVPPDEVPAAFRQLTRGDFADDPFRPQLATLRKVLTTGWEGRSMPMYTFITANGLELVSFGGGTGGCPLMPDFPVLFVCGGGWSGPGAPVSVHGRVGDGVAAVTAGYADGTTRDATVGNGFFILLMPRSQDAPERLVARDAGGAVLATLEAGAPGASALVVAGP
jgi:hypothetical protein